MTLNYKAKIIVDAKDKTKAIFDSVNTDNEFYPENPVKTKIDFDKELTISVESNHLASFTCKSKFNFETDSSKS